jgi:hypothetical protein
MNYVFLPSSGRLRTFIKTATASVFLDCLTLEDGKGQTAPETSVTNYQPTLRNIPEEREPQFQLNLMLQVSVPIRNYLIINKMSVDRLSQIRPFSSDTKSWATLPSRSQHSIGRAKS